MSRIRTTGLRSSRPTLESLETREVAAADFGRALLSSLAPPPAAAQVRQPNPPATPPANADLNKEILAAGHKVAEQVIQQFVQRNFQFSDADFKNVGELKGTVFLVERINNTYQPDHGGLQVGVALNRSADYVHDDSIHVTLDCTLLFRFKYEGRVDGVDRFTLSSFRSKDFSRWTSDLDGGRHNRKDISPSAYFGVVDAELKKQYATFSSPVAHAAPPQAAALDQVFAAMGGQGLAHGQAGVATAPQGRAIDQIIRDQLSVGVNGNLGDNWRIRGFEAVSATPDGRDFVVQVKVNVTWWGRKEETQTLSIRLTPSNKPGHYTVTSLEQGQQGFQFSAHKLGEMRRAVTDVQFRP